MDHYTYADLSEAVVDMQGGQHPTPQSRDLGHARWVILHLNGVLVRGIATFRLSWLGNQMAIGQKPETHTWPVFQPLFVSQDAAITSLTQVVSI